MILLDANIFLYAYNSAAEEHKFCRRWLEKLLASNELLGLPWVTLWAFLRISTNPRLFPRPMTIQESCREVGSWIALPRVSVVEPGPRHFEILLRLIAESRAVGPLLSDAVLAALAVEHGAILASTDLDFSKFTEVRWISPLRQNQ